MAVLSWLGLAFLLFLAGLEIDARRLGGGLLGKAAVGYLMALALATPFAVALAAAGWIDEPVLLVVTLSATSLGLVVPVLRDAGQNTTALGQGLVVACTVADLASIVLLSVLFGAEGDTRSRVALILSFAAVVATAVLAADRWTRLQRVVASLQESTAQIRIRLALVLLVALTALAGRFGVETILGAFVAGVVLSIVDPLPRDHPRSRAGLDAVGFGVLIPIFYVTTGLRLDLAGLLQDPAALVRVPVLLLVLLVARGLPALLYARSAGARAAVAAGLLQATSLPFIATASQVGVELHLMPPVTAAALVTAGVLSVALFPTLLHRTDHHKAIPDPVSEPPPHPAQQVA
ncbi:cation:proton antiporter [Embleya sp. NPDC005575]|uniref:cation:proton antiporter domain-containing protein n=1 Tax=Embleya sp. NPDC005575 TaxID=3156892 RepID=UPI0033A06822